jgi:hypothetical protein
MSQTSSHDILIDLCQTAALDITEATARTQTPSITATTTLSIPNQVTLYNGTIATVPPPSAGSVAKMSLKSHKLGIDELLFIVFAYEVGVECSAEKLSPESAERLMKTIGTPAATISHGKYQYIKDTATADGRPLFLRYQLLDKWTLKTHFSKVYYTNCKATLEKMRRRKNPNDAKVSDFTVAELKQLLIARGVVNIKNLLKPRLRELLEDARNNNLPIVIVEQPEEEEEEDSDDDELDRDTIQIIGEDDFADEHDNSDCDDE